ncbi:YiiX/YebB-like N1pC/P60 family cysteine hydrolase [Neisseriaceae bacterium ESL0693]|nr:YiiX/YebB-like N1pC/P60 family cysteine hydrolase [Neisseriaceae bacterium ESL0693]
MNMQALKHTMLWLTLLLMVAWVPAYADTFRLQEGDLIFQEGCQGDMNGAIKAATGIAGSRQFTHVGIVWEKSPNHFMVIEATPPAVTATPLADYLHPPQKCRPYSVVGRLKQPYRHLIPQAMVQAQQKIGKLYDNAFDINNDQYYCSELIYQIFKEANHQQPLFPLVAMTFRSKQTGEFPAYWVEHFRQLNIPIPEGKPGNNPADMSRSDLIDLVHAYGH